MVLKCSDRNLKTSLSKFPYLTEKIIHEYDFSKLKVSNKNLT